jgi:hypothetical protein
LVVADLLFPSDNEWGVPALTLGEPEAAPPAVTAPIAVWGSTTRRSQVATWCFYCDDYRFAGLWREPDAALIGGAGALVEPNYSVFDDSPAAVAIWAVYRKRWLAAYWQRAGASVWVDVCVAHRHAALNLLGVPRGWQRYATAGWDARVGDLDFELELCRRHAAGWPFTLMVYGGGQLVTEWCRRADVVHVGHRADARKRPGEGTRRRLAREAKEVA